MNRKSKNNGEKRVYKILVVLYIRRAYLLLVSIRLSVSRSPALFLSFRCWRDDRKILRVLGVSNRGGRDQNLSE